MALSTVGWMNGLSASGIVIFGSVFGLFWMYKGKKTNAKLLFYWGLAAIFFSLCWLGDLVDFLTILLTGKNMDNSYGLYALISWMWFPPFMIVALYIGAALMIPEKKRYVLYIYTVLGVIFEIFLFFDLMNSCVFFYPKTPGEELISINFIYSSPLGVIDIIFSLIGFILIGFGFLFKAIQSTGLLRKKFLILLIASLSFMIFAILDGSLPPGIIKVLVRIGIVISYWIWYLGLREEPEKKERTKPKKEVKIEGDLFRISKRPDQITEEEISISKEKKICLVCKGNISGINYICTECGAFYCMKCSQAISNLENECWACNSPIDKSKPSKPFKKEEVDIEISEEPQKKPKTKK